MYMCLDLTHVILFDADVLWWCRLLTDEQEVSGSNFGYGCKVNLSHDDSKKWW